MVIEEEYRRQNTGDRREARRRQKIKKRDRREEKKAQKKETEYRRQEEIKKKRETGVRIQQKRADSLNGAPGEGEASRKGGNGDGDDEEISGSESLAKGSSACSQNL